MIRKNTVPQINIIIDGLSLSIGKKLKERRLGLNQSLDAVSEKVGIERMALWRIENCYNSIHGKEKIPVPKLESLIKLSLYYKIPLSELIAI